MVNIFKVFFDGLSPKEKKILYVALALIIAAIFDRLVIGPISVESKRTEEEIDGQLQLIKKNIRILEYKKRIESEDDAYSKYYAKSGATQEELIASFLSEIEDFSKSSGVVLNNINPVETEDKEGFQEYSLTVECSGSMQNLLDFFYEIDNAEKPIRVVSYEISVKNREQYEVKCILTAIKMIISRQKPISENPEERNMLTIKEKVTI